MSENRVALVTGANKGIGKEIARQLAQHGLRVFLGARDETRGTVAVKELQSQGLSVELLILDIENIGSIRSAADRLFAEVGRLDILINNAGAVYEYGAPSQSDPALLRKTFETNFFGAVSVTQAMLPLLRKSDHKVIVNVSSGLGSLAQHSLPESRNPTSINILAYNSSKTALNAFTVLLAKELRPEGFRVNSVCPGYISTDLNEHRGPGTVEEGARISVRCALAGPDGPTGCYLAEGGTLPW